MAELIIQAAEKQAMILISHSGQYVKYQANMQTLLNMAGLEVELVSSACPPTFLSLEASELPSS